ncbi:hypothetical protein E2C01_082108 [Portunus trituberculatus]|uniref:Uncharacterized protein n=1 Tax=Portunus trituberculatus TaxID=210409 RepID=A0A5B7IP34_PORTR|nr:hypothetical protein [Portunus trituberculatus]
MPPPPPQHQIWRCSQRNQPAHMLHYLANVNFRVYALQQEGASPPSLGLVIKQDDKNIHEVRSRVEARKSLARCDDFPSDIVALSGAQTFINSHGLV